jgi:3-hydroxybutyrate dehydrogenase
MRLENKVAVVTGAASGIGKEIARAFVREGAKVGIADLDQDGAGATAKELDRTGRRVIGIAMDVTNEAQARRASPRRSPRLAGSIYW